jgi:hypothetical protein
VLTGASDSVMQQLLRDRAADTVRRIVASKRLNPWHPLWWHLGMHASNRAVAHKHPTTGQP